MVMVMVAISFFDFFCLDLHILRWSKQNPPTKDQVSPWGEQNLGRDEILG